MKPDENGGALADELGVLLAQLAPLQRREKALKEKLKALGRTAVEGALFRITVSESISERLDARMVRTEMGDAWFSAHSNAVVAITVRCGPKVGAAPPDQQPQDQAA